MRIYLYAWALLLAAFCSGCVSSPYIKVNCKNGDPVFVLKDKSQAYPIYAKQYEQQFKISVDSIKEVLAKGNLDLGRKTEIVKLRQDLDQDRSAIQMQLRSIADSIDGDPCDRENRKRMADLQVQINQRLDYLSRIAAGIKEGVIPPKPPPIVTEGGSSQTNPPVITQSHPTNQPPVVVTNKPPIVIPPPAPAFAFGESKQIELTQDNPKRGATHTYGFDVPVEQGDKLRFTISANGAAIKTRVYVFAGGSKGQLETSSIKTGTHIWTMSKGIPGTKAHVEVLSWSLGTLSLRVDKAQ